MLLEQERARLAEEARLAEQARLEAERVRQQGEFDTRLGAARTDAEGRIRTGFEQRGVNPDDFSQFIADELGRRQSSVPNLAANPGSYFDAITDAVIGNVTNQQRRDFGNQFDQFAGTGFAQNMWQGTADDALIDQIIGDQFNPAAQQLLNAQQRGNLTESAFQAAMAQLENDRTTVGSRLQGIGGGLLETNRQALRDIAGEGRQGAANFQLGQTFDPMSFQNRINTTFADQQGRFEGDLRGLIGNDPLFDISNIVQTQQSRQGVTGGQSPLLDAFAEDQQRRRQQQGRGIGQQGQF